MPLQDFIPSYIHGSKTVFVLALVGSAISSALGMLTDVMSSAGISPAQHIEFLIKCIYALAGAIVTMAASGALLLSWLGKNALKVIADNSRSNRELARDVNGLRQIMDVQMQYFNGVAINAINGLDRDSEIPADLPTELSTGPRRPQNQPKTKRYP